uniref:Teneurin N-terminal domain-containing protein n=1 Tax=Knipowitschia caucasica TaxID=637954 RepID=A0AAV2MKP1_KNICA
MGMSVPHHPSPGPSPPIRECQVPLLEKNSNHSHLDPHPEDAYLLRGQPTSTGTANHHSQSTLRPPLPPPHNHHTVSHQSANSLNRNTLRGGRNPIHAPAPGTGDGPTTPESVQLQDSWVLNSNVPLETRHFLFKTSSGTTPLFSSSSPGYPLTSGTVYSPPPRLLPRNTFSRSAFKLKKPSKYCSWKCAAVSAIAAAALLAILLSYFIAINLLGLTWQLKPSDGPMLNNGLGAGLPVNSDVATLPSGGRGPWAGRNSSIDTGSVEVGRRVSQEVPPGVFWRSLLHLSQPQFLKFNISLGKDALFGVYIRKGLPPSHAQYDYMERLDGKEKWSVVESPRERRSIQTVVLNEAVFVQYLDAGAWHLAFYNDGRERETVSFSTNIMEGGSPERRQPREEGAQRGGSPERRRREPREKGAQRGGSPERREPREEAAQRGGSPERRQPREEAAQRGGSSPERRQQPREEAAAQTGGSSPERREPREEAARRGGSPERRQPREEAAQRGGSPERREPGEEAARRGGSPERRQPREEAAQRGGSPERRQPGEEAAQRGGESPEKRQPGEEAALRGGSPERRQPGEEAAQRGGSPERRQPREEGARRGGSSPERRQPREEAAQRGGSPERRQPREEGARRGGSPERRQPREEAAQRGGSPERRSCQD